MAKINRTIQPLIQKYLFKNKIIIIYGARQVGKTTLVKIILDHFAGQYFNCDLLQTRNALAQQDPIILKRIFGDAKLIVIDEAQRISNIGLTLKITHEYFPQIQIIATGSSSFDLANKINEPLTGRALEFKLYPFSLQELKQSYSFLELEKQMQSMLIFGSYPEIVTASEDDTILFLDNLASKYLYKDILEFESLKKPDLLVKLLQLLALQIGSECSKHELAISLQVNRLTI